MRINPLQNKFLLIFVLLTALVLSPAYAANDTYTIHDQPYTLFPTFVVMFSIGMAFLIISLLATPEQNNDAFAAMAIVPLFVSSWMAMQLDFPAKIVISDVLGEIWTQHHIYPSIPLAIFIFVLAVIACAQLYRLLTASKIEEPVSDGQYPQSRQSNYPDNDEE